MWGMCVCLDPDNLPQSVRVSARELQLALERVRIARNTFEEPAVRDRNEANIGERESSCGCSENRAVCVCCYQECVLARTVCFVLC